MICYSKIFQIGLLIIILITLISCKNNIIKEIDCDDNPFDEECVCKQDLVKKMTPYGSYCANITCLHCADNLCKTYYDISEYTFKGKCVAECPFNYAPFEYHDLAEDKYYKFCFYITNQSEMICDNYPFYNECFCPEGLTKRATLSGFYCRNITCDGYLMESEECVSECPEGYVISYVYDVGRNAYCVPEDD